MGVKGYYFSFDAFMGAAIIILGVLLATSIYNPDTETSQITYTSRDIVSVLSELKISEANNSYAASLIESGEIKNLNNSILEQIGEFWAANRTDEAKYLALNFTAPFIKGKYGFGIYANDIELYSTPSGARSLVSSKKLITGIANGKPTEGYTSRAMLSQLSGKLIKEYAYFGGYVGDGNITVRMDLRQFDTIKEAYFEGVVNDSFTLYINGFYSGTYKDAVAMLKRADNYTINQTYFANLRHGTNFLVFEFNKTRYIGGGFFRVSYNLSQINYSNPDYDGTYMTRKEYLHGVDGVINVFSSFYVPGDLQSMTVFLNYTSDYPFFVNFGSDLIYDNNMTDPQQVNITIPNSDIASKINYANLSKKTVPLRIGHYDVSKFPNLSRVSDAVITTDVTSSMDTQDVPDAPGQSRLEVAKGVEKTFASYVLSANPGENRVGLVGYHSATSASRALDLTADNATVQSKIDSYSTVGGDNTCFSCALADARDQLITLSDANKTRAIVLMSDGEADKCVTPPSSCGSAAAKAEAISIACSIYGNYSISIYAIGFGNGADNATLKNISQNCSNGKFYHINNQSELENAFKEIADELLALEFSYQQAVSQGVYSALYPNSYIEMTYIPTIPPLTFGQVPVTIETAPFGNNLTTGTIFLPVNATLSDVTVTSYSGYYWTSNVSLNNGSWHTVYNINDYGGDYPIVGDPYSIHISPTTLVSGSNSIHISTAASQFNTSGGSPDNRAVYTMLVSSALSFSGVYGKADGCIWNVQFEDATNATLTIPQSYNGTASCYFKNQSYDGADAVNAAIFDLLGQLDLDNNGMLDVNLNQNSLTLDTTTVSKVPSLWGPSVIEVRVWQ